MFGWGKKKENKPDTKQVNVGKAQIKISTRHKTFLFDIEGYKSVSCSVYSGLLFSPVFVETVYQKFVDDSKHFVRVNKHQHINSRKVTEIKMINRQDHLVTIPVR